MGQQQINQGTLESQSLYEAPYDNNIQKQHHIMPPMSEMQSWSVNQAICRQLNSSHREYNAVQTCFDMSRMTGWACDWNMTIIRPDMLVISDAQSDNKVLTAFFSISHTSWQHQPTTHTSYANPPCVVGQYKLYKFSKHFGNKKLSYCRETTWSVLCFTRYGT